MKSAAWLPVGCLFLGLYCTCGPALDDAPDAPAVTIAGGEGNGDYLSLNGERQLVVGFNLRNDTLDFRQLREVVKSTARSGGNYLSALPDGVDQREQNELQAIANEAGIVLDWTGTIAGVQTADNVATFNRRLLDGAAGMVFGEYTQRALNALRGLRTVQLHLDLWDVRLDEAILDGSPGGAVSAATDGRGNYLIYTPTRGRVALQLDDEQVPRRVTVVGHLGTQRSEILYPPYDRTFSLLSNDERGGWIIIERLEAE